MAKIFETIDDKLERFVRDQHLFFVATAPLSGDGHINLSPKGLDSLRILGPNRVAYLDLTGSGAETIAHVKENGRICLMFCALEGKAKILRFHGTGTVHEVGSPGFDALAEHFSILPGARSIINVEVSRIADSCGWGVPVYSYEGERDQLIRYAEHMSAEEIEEARQKGNTASIDGLPAYGRS